ncbi:nucleoside hydrolase [Phocea massiliensis]|uniref:Nucleoside hydrolase n=1 Tax=Merdimmobilis hominis TaxID=2897707 RepID=A0A939BDG5_9FIRM|nr:nucleoside hydrolase [Merdimmobilis hominis]MBM6920185.1 nucleoside hydrolase [Merdimmobilis hominis]
MKNPIILDTDPGIDDAVAMIVLHHFCKERVRLIVAGYGNIKAEQTVKNALMMCELLDMDVPVLPGAVVPQMRGYEDAAHIHGADGLGGMALGTVTKKPLASDDFLKTLYETIKEAGTVDYITLGPLTNLALLLKRYPDVASHIARVVTMGGGIACGNVTPHAEFNIHCDAESADQVFASGLPVALVPLDTTNHVAFSMEQINALADVNTPLASLMQKILTANYENCTRYGEEGSTMHDSTAVLYYLFPEYFETIQCGITVDCGERYGKTQITDRRNNVTLIQSGESETLCKLILSCITAEGR